MTAFDQQDMTKDFATTYQRPEKLQAGDYFAAKISAMHIRGQDEIGPFINTYFYVRDNPRIIINLDMSQHFDYSCISPVDDVLRTWNGTRQRCEQLPGEYVLRMTEQGQNQARVVDKAAAHDYLLAQDFVDTGIRNILATYEKSPFAALELASQVRAGLGRFVDMGYRFAYEKLDRLADIDVDIFNSALGQVLGMYEGCIDMVGEVTPENVLTTDRIPAATTQLVMTAALEDRLKTGFARMLSPEGGLSGPMKYDQEKISDAKETLETVLSWRDEIAEYRKNFDVHMKRKKGRPYSPRQVKKAMATIRKLRDFGERPVYAAKDVKHVAESLNKAIKKLKVDAISVIQSSQTYVPEAQLFLQQLANS
ncbi:hypothetical protein KY363_00020 [Candidatus Woesearchaeota archaeon]|nr:hypothetical protein [Candidatus Woesearchaeota archaeon]